MRSGISWSLVVPFAYVTVTRMRSIRAFGYNALMAWIPALGLLLADGQPLAWAVLALATGYLAFIAIYELGYLANDAWDARRGDQGRKRLAATPSKEWFFAFVVSRLANFALIAWLTEWWRAPAWSLGFAALVVVFAAHNLVSVPARLATFPLLAILRFLLPIAATLSTGAWPAALIVAAGPYMLPRWLAYAESKDLLPRKVRHRTRFRSRFLLAIGPLVALGAWWAQSIVPIAALAYYLVVTFLAEPREQPAHPPASA